MVPCAAATFGPSEEAPAVPRMKTTVPQMRDQTLTTPTCDCACRPRCCRLCRMSWQRAVVKHARRGQTMMAAAEEEETRTTSAGRGQQQQPRQQQQQQQQPPLPLQPQQTALTSKLVEKRSASSAAVHLPVQTVCCCAQ